MSRKLLNVYWPIIFRLQLMLEWKIFKWIYLRSLSFRLFNVYRGKCFVELPVVQFSHVYIHRNRVQKNM